MGTFNEFTITPKKYNNDQLRINYRMGRIGGHIGTYKFIDKDTKQNVVYCPSLELSGYGETLAKAYLMLQFNIQEFFEYLSKLSPDKIQIEFSKLGWKKGIFNKEFSKAYVDINGQLQSLNAENNKVERITLTMA